MKKLILASALTLVATGAMAHDIDVSVTDFRTHSNAALGFDADWADVGGLAEGTNVQASTAYAGSVVVDASTDSSMEVYIDDVRTRDNIALGNAGAGSIIIGSKND